MTNSSKTSVDALNTMDAVSPVTFASSLRRMSLETTETLIVVIEDPGAECDDEANKAMFNKMAKGKTKVLYLAVNGEKTSLERLARCDEMGVSPPKDSSHARQVGLENWNTTCLSLVDDLSKVIPQKGRVILQHNAPVFGDDVKHVETLAYFLEQAQSRGNIDYFYFTQGTFRKCVNTAEGKGLEVANRLKRAAKVAFCTDSRQNMKFSYNSSKAVGAGVLRVSGLVFVQNTLGRAPADGFCRHLVGPGGANYNSTRSMYLNVKKVTDPDWDAIKPSARAVSASQVYCDPNNPANFPKAEEFAATKCDMLKQTNQDQIDGLAKMLQAYKILFDIDEGTVLFSSDQKWVNADKGGKFYGIYKKVMDAMKVTPDAEWTPAYDPTCAALVFAYMCEIKSGPAIKKGKITEWFDAGDESEDGIIPMTWKGVETLEQVTKEMNDAEF